jgi:hypothetical protein
MWIMVKLVRFLEKYRKVMEINWDEEMGIVMEMVKLLEGMSEEYEDVMKINLELGNADSGEIGEIFGEV